MVILMECRVQFNIILFHGVTKRPDLPNSQTACSEIRTHGCNEFENMGDINCSLVRRSIQHHTKARIHITFDGMYDVQVSREREVNDT